MILHTLFCDVRSKEEYTIAGITSIGTAQIQYKVVNVARTIHYKQGVKSTRAVVMLLYSQLSFCLLNPKP
jgi:hypothetical protein